MKNKEIKPKYKRRKNIEIEEEQYEGNKTEQNIIKEKRETNWIKLLEEELDQFSIGESEDENQVMSEKEETDMGDIKKDKINILPNLSITDKKDNINLNTNNEKRMSKIKEKINNFEIVDDEITKCKDSIIFDGKEYRSYSRYNYYNNKRKINKIIYKCINIRKDEKFRKDTNQNAFCNATIEYIEPGQNIKSGYLLNLCIRSHVLN